MTVRYSDTDSEQHKRFRNDIADIAARMREAQQELIRFAERGVPVKATRSRLARAESALGEALMQWDYDVINGYERGTRADRERRDEHELT